MNELQFILGGAKTGKSTYIQKQIQALCENLPPKTSNLNQKEILLIVPEQFSYEAERSLFKFAGAATFLNIKVTSFTRLSTEIFREFGGISGNHADDCAKIILMNKALKSCRPDLQKYNKSAKYTSFATKMISIIKEFKIAGITLDDLDIAIESISKESKNEYLNLKLSDIKIIYHAFDNELATSFIDPTDEIKRAIDLLKKDDNINFIKDKHIFIDEFKSFTKLEKDFLQLMMSNSNVYMSLCIDTKRDDTKLLTPFATIFETRSQIMKIAQSSSVTIKKNIILEDEYDFKLNETLSHLKHNIFTYNPEKYELDDAKDSINAIICTDEYDELEYVLSTIKHLVGDENNNYCYNDIAVVARDLTCYNDIYENLFEKYEIPVFCDKVVSVVDQPLIRFVQGFLNCIKNSTSENILSMLKCELVPFNLNSISTFENYLYVWDIKSQKGLAKELTQNPSGFKNNLSENEAEQLEKINLIREYCYNNINEFKSKVKDANGYDFCTNLMEIVKTMKVKENLDRKITNWRKEGDKENVELYTRVWEIFNELLSVIANTIGDTQVDINNFCDLFSLVASTYDMGCVPQTLDNVTLGQADRIRISNKKVIFVLSVNEGILPLTPVNNSILSINERDVLSNANLLVEKLGMEKIQEERFIAYQTLTFATEKLYLTSRTRNSNGDKLTPSIIINDVKKIFGDDVVSTSIELPIEYYCHNNNTALKQYLFSDDENTINNLKEAFIDNEIITNKLIKLDNIKNQKGFKISDNNITKELFYDKAEDNSKSITLSTTKIEKYYDCPFLYFCHYGLGVRKLERAKINPMHTGNLIHQILDNVVKNAVANDFLNKPFDIDTMQTEIKKEVGIYIEEKMGGSADKSDRFMYICNRMEKPILQIVKRIHNEFTKSQFKPIGFESQIGTLSKYCKISHLELNTQDTKIKIEGKVDRIDSCITATEKYIRVIDYKSGNKKFDLNDVFNGISLQMLIYLNAIQEGGTEEFENGEPAGILYMPSGELSPKDTQDVKEDKTDEFLKGYQMNGLIVYEPPQVVVDENRKPILTHGLPSYNPPQNSFNMLEAMEGAKAIDTEYIPTIKLPPEAKQSPKTGKYSTAVVPKYKMDNSLVTSSQLTDINNHIKGLITQMVESLYNGEIQAQPLNKEKLPCDYCDYKSVCSNVDIKEENTKPYEIEKDTDKLREKFKK